MSGLFAGTPLERPVTCEVCEKPLDVCACPRDAAGCVLLPEKQTATVRMEKRRKGKVVTTVSGLDRCASDLDGIVKALKAACGAGGTVDAATGVIEVQGDHRQRIAQQLRDMRYKVKVL